MVTGTAAERRQILAEADSEDILLTSYDLLKRDISEYEGYKFRCEIIDEAQYIKNANTQAAKAVKEVQADFRLALTGTPVENRLSELWSIFDYLMPVSFTVIRSSGKKLKFRQFRIQMKMQ